MILNVGGWLLLTVFFSVLLLIVQRVERKRRLITAIIMLFVAILVWRYALYRIGTDCNVSWPVLCPTLIVSQHFQPIAQATADLSVVGALMVNFVYWALFGRYNPPGTSDSIKVFGLDME